MMTFGLKLHYIEKCCGCIVLFNAITCSVFPHFTRDLYWKDGAERNIMDIYPLLSATFGWMGLSLISGHNRKYQAIGWLLSACFTAQLLIDQWENLSIFGSIAFLSFAALALIGGFFAYTEPNGKTIIGAEDAGFTV